MEVASGALESGCDVTVVSLDPPMGLQLGDYLSGLFVNAALARGLRLVRQGAAGLTSSGDVDPRDARRTARCSRRMSS